MDFGTKFKSDAQTKREMEATGYELRNRCWHREFPMRGPDVVVFIIQYVGCLNKMPSWKGHVGEYAGWVSLFNRPPRKGHMRISDVCFGDMPDEVHRMLIRKAREYAKWIVEAVEGKESDNNGGDE